mmetsp:Transcript_109616/g.266461  ORF Transcript_109616/g.266461 Transcript_109616/m.266461 type:complete len:318 (-) Transcript_109616:609-1562(-)
MVILARLELDQGVKRHLIADAVHRAPPALLLDLPADVDVDAERNGESGQGPPVVDGEHDGEADHEAAARRAQVPHAPALLVDARRPPCRGLQPGQREAGDVHEGVCNQKAHGQQWRHKVQLADQDQDGSNKVGRPQCTLGLAVRQRRQLVQEPDDLVLGNGLEQPRRDDAALQRLAQGGDDDAQDGGLREGVPDDLLHHSRTRSAAARQAPSMAVSAARRQALKVGVLGHTAPEDHVGRVHEEAEDDGSEGAVSQVLGGVLQNVRAVCATEDAREAGEKDTEHVAKVLAIGVVAIPIHARRLQTETGDIRISSCGIG